MRLLVVGGGVIGVTTAYYLARAGFDVCVIDREDGPALECSFANAGQISPGYASPWAAPGIPIKALRWLFMRHSPLFIKPFESWAQVRWGLQMLRNCTAARYETNKSRMVRLAEYSRNCLKALRESTGIAYEGRQQGTLQVFRTQKQIDAAARDIAVLEQCGVAYELLDAKGCARAEPGLAATAHKLVGGLRLPGDETGDCHLFTRALAELAREAGVRFSWRRTIDRFDTSAGRVTGVRCDGEVLPADHFVIACGSYSTRLVQRLGLSLPVYPVKGFSLTVPIRDHAASPVSTIMHETYKVAITRFDDRIRVGGMAELSGFDLKLPPRRRSTLGMVLTDLFPHAGDLSTASFWAGLRPMTPDGTPIIGRTRYGNVWLNTGHGTLGWTMACGSGQLLTDLIAGREPAIRSDDLHLGRYA